jgi:hypothetical protein
VQHEERFPDVAGQGDLPYGVLDLVRSLRVDVVGGSAWRTGLVLTERYTWLTTAISECSIVFGTELLAVDALGEVSK